jgi:hypothetical protein
MRMRVKDLRPSDRNPRTISTSRFENLKRSLQQDRAFLDARPLLVNAYPGRENIVIAGNMRLRAAQGAPRLLVRSRVRLAFAARSSVKRCPFLAAR